MTPYVQVMTSVATKEDAEKIATKVLEKKLAACVQITPILSLYRWQGAIEKEHEYSCIIKSKQELFIELRKEIEQLHPYEVPEILATPIVDGGKPYLDWLQEALKQ